MSNPMKLVRPTMDDEIVELEIGQLIVRTIEEMRDQGIDDRIQIKVSAENYTNSETDIEFSVAIAYQDSIVSDSISKSADTAVSIYFKKKGLHPKKLAHYK
jgi:uncharacterized protein (UPF0305 family)